MIPKKALPYPPEFSDVDTYVNSLLEFGTTSTLLQNLCGGVHILDFFTREPTLYDVVIPEDWRSWFRSQDVYEVLDFLMREDLPPSTSYASEQSIEDDTGVPKASQATLPPSSLIHYVREVRRHCLLRDFAQAPRDGEPKSLSRLISVGMKPKKAHEVHQFAQYVDRVVDYHDKVNQRPITHLVDFGSGQNYLGRALAAPPYNRRIIAVESRPHVVEMSRKLDVIARVVERPRNLVNKKAFRAAVEAGTSLPGEKTNKSSNNPFYTTENGYNVKTSELVETVKAKLETAELGKGSVQYVEYNIKDGDLAPVVDQILEPKFDPNAQHDNPESISSATMATNPGLLVMSLHSCGNLLHHGLRTIVMNPSVRAVAMVGCCYNLMTERLGPPTYKIPALRSNHPRLEATSTAFDPHGFPMSGRFVNFRINGGHDEHDARHRRPTRANRLNAVSNGSTGHGLLEDDSSRAEKIPSEEDCAEGFDSGIRLNITSRMMAVQAPQNWTRSDSAGFFTRHFYRALLQRIFLDKGVISAPIPSTCGHGGTDYDATNGSQGMYGGVSPAGSSSRGPGTEPIVIGALSKKCYESFANYVRGAIKKLTSSNSPSSSSIGRAVENKIGSLSDGDISAYETQYIERKKELSIVWSLMAFSAGVIESMIVVDRWLWLTEQKEVGEAWVEPVFDYAQSPRNLAVVGIRK